ncbi:hypothetical protein HAX54_029946 [Datura stramonium]|uniref:Uncharacterized protein n=1 Tax=Datura stramonium TaxID=4076 RepID=A0ABS8V777_DATST|nr:hypothetical protein [Datura stramonium]
MLPSLTTTPLSLFILSLFIFPSTAVPTTTTTIGFTYSPAANSPPPDHVVTALQSLKIPAVRLLNPSPALIRAFSYSNISLLLTVPNHLVGSFASNRSSATLWLYNNVLPFHPRARISLISVGSDVISSSDVSDPSTSLVPAMQNLHHALLDLGIRTVSVSTTFSFINVITTAFPPSSAEFQEPVNSLVVRPVLEFLEETNSSLLMNVYPYNVYQLRGEIPVGFALFQEGPFYFRDDVVTGVRYHNLFDMMVDAVIAAMAVSGYENVPLILTETGWPSNDEHMNAEESQLYAEKYLQGLVSHLKSGLGTPLRKEGAAEAYIYQLFDDTESNQTNNLSSDGGTVQKWGVMYRNLTMKYNINFDNADQNSRMLGVLVPSIYLLWLLYQLLFCLLVWIDD